MRFFLFYKNPLNYMLISNADMNLDNVYQTLFASLCQMCEAFLTHGHGLSHGRRQVGIGNDAHVAQLCGGCCDTDACNRNGCYTISEYISCNIVK